MANNLYEFRLILFKTEKIYINNYSFGSFYKLNVSGINYGTDLILRFYKSDLWISQANNGICLQYGLHCRYVDTVNNKSNSVGRSYERQQVWF
jgi:hypothetical protein